MKGFEKVFGIADKGSVPQAYVATMVEVRRGLSRDFGIDRARASEKDHLIQMAPDLHPARVADG